MMPQIILQFVTTLPLGIQDLKLNSLPALPQFSPCPASLTLTRICTRNFWQNCADVCCWRGLKPTVLDTKSTLYGLYEEVESLSVIEFTPKELLAYFPLQCCQRAAGCLLRKCQPQLPPWGGVSLLRQVLLVQQHGCICVVCGGSAGTW